MGIIEVKRQGNFKALELYLQRKRTNNVRAILERYGQQGVEALKAATPVRTGLTAESWYYEIEESPESYSIRWYNSNVQNGSPIAVLIQFGHGTRNGGYVEGIDYINPVIQPLFEQAKEEIWREVTK